MSKFPPIPPEQRHFASDKPDLDETPPQETKGSNLRERGDSANRRQNLNPQRALQGR